MTQRLAKFGFVNVLDSSGKNRLFRAMGIKESGHIRANCHYKPIPSNELSDVLCCFYDGVATHSMVKSKDPALMTEAMLRKFRKSQQILHSDLPPVRLLITKVLIGESEFSGDVYQTQLETVRNIGIQLGMSFSSKRDFSHEALYTEADINTCVQLMDEVESRNCKAIHFRFVDSQSLTILQEAAFESLSKAALFVPEGEQEIPELMSIERIAFEDRFGNNQYVIQAKDSGIQKAIVVKDVGQYLLKYWFPLAFEKITDKELVQTMTSYLEKVKVLQKMPGIECTVKCTVDDGDDFKSYHKRVIAEHGTKIDSNTYTFSLGRDTSDGLMYALEKESLTKHFVVI